MTPAFSNPDNRRYGLRISTGGFIHEFHYERNPQEEQAPPKIMEK